MKLLLSSIAGPLLLLSPAVLPQSGLLQSLAAPQGYQALRVSSYDRTGGNRDSLRVPPGKEVLLADLQGPGAVTHIWFTISSREKGHLRKLILRAWWDGEKNPSIECPIGDFFGCHHARPARFSSLPIAIGSKRALNCFWHMPFAQGARFTLQNLGKMPVGALYYYIDYRKLSRPPSTPMRFHAQFRCAFPCRGGDYTILEAKGRGHYVGVTMGVRLRKNGWWGEGDDKIFVDGHKYPALHGTGSEDYFCGAWCYGETFSAPFFGLPLRPEGHPKGGLWTVYRFHLADPVPFESSVRVTIEHGHKNNRSDDFTTVAYWYQVEPHAPFPALPAAAKLFPPPWSRLPWKRKRGPSNPGKSPNQGIVFFAKNPPRPLRFSRKRGILPVSAREKKSAHPIERMRSPAQARRVRMTSREDGGKRRPGSPQGPAAGVRCRV